MIIVIKDILSYDTFMKKLLLLFIFIYSALFAQTITRTKVQMGTFITIVLNEKDASYVEEGFEIISRVEKALSSYDENAEISRLNKSRKIDIEAYTYQALLLSQRYYKESDGYFDVTVGSITKDLYRFGEDERVPSFFELSNAIVDFNGISFDKNRASLADGVKVDLGGMGKGFSIDMVSQHYKEHNITNAIISASGDIRCFNLCSVDVQNPLSKNYLVSFKTTQKNSSITTSGNYNRYVDSTKNNHLINPKTKNSQTKFVSITLISQLANSDIDAYATTASVMPLKKAYNFLDSLDLAYIVLQSDGKLVFSRNIDGYIEIKK